MPKYKVYLSKTESWSVVVEAEDEDAAWEHEDISGLAFNGIEIEDIEEIMEVDRGL